MSMTRVWNITSDPSTDVQPQNLMVLGKLLRPGQSMQIDDAKLKKAHKVLRDVDAKLLVIGKGTPSYLSASAKASLPKSVARAHGEVPTEAIAADAPAKVEEKLSEKPAEEKPSEEVKTEGEDRGFGRHRRGR